MSKARDIADRKLAGTDLVAGDNDKAIFGTGSDLQIYHNGSNSYISEVGTGNLYIEADNQIYIRSATGEVYGKFEKDSAVTLYHNNLPKLATTSTGIDVTGTATMDGLTVDGGDNTTHATFGGGRQLSIKSEQLSGLYDDAIYKFDINSTVGIFKFSNATNTKDLLKLDYNGDISFYEDTGTTAKFFWDASAESLGIGTSSPSSALDVIGNIESSGSATIGGGVYTSNGSAGFPVHTFSGDNDTGMYQAGSNQLGFTTGGSERMRIDSSGNFLVDTTDTALFDSSAADNTADGFLYRGNGVGLTACSRYNGNPLVLNRTGSDGDIAIFRKSGTTVGSIAARSGGLCIDFRTGATGAGLSGTSAGRNILPGDGNGGIIDNAVDLGLSSFRFDDIYATNGTIQTSDANEKQDIDVLNDAEQRVAQACKGLLRKFRWKDAVAEKGDDARIHFGIIAQDLKAAFEAEGLDAGKYAMFISSTWTDEETGEERTRMGVRYPELLAFIIATL